MQLARWMALTSWTLSLCGCATSHEVTPIVIDAARKAMACEPIEVTALRTQKYEVRGCGQTTYWLCFNPVHSPPDYMCCEPVDSKAKLLKLFVLARPQRRVCGQVAADVPLLSQ